MMNYSKPYLFIFILAILFISIDIIFSVGNTWIQQFFINLIDEGSLEKLMTFVQISLAIGLGCLAMMIIQFLLRNYTISYISRDFTLKFFEECNKIPLLEANKYSSGDLVNRINKDAPAASHIIDFLVFNILFHILMSVVVFIYLARIDFFLALLALIGGPSSFLIGKLFDMKIRSVTVDAQKKDADVRNILQEMMQGLKVVKSLCIEKTMHRKYKVERNKQNKLFMKRALLTSFREQSIELSFNAIAYTCTFFVAVAAIRNEITPGQVLAFLFLTMRLMGPFLGIAQMWSSLQMALGAGDRVYKIGNLFKNKDESDISVESDQSVSDRTNAAIKIVDGTFSYQKDKELFNHFNLTVGTGKSVAIVGPSGSGKSTLAKLCGGLYELDSGNIEIFGHSLNDNKEKVRSKIAYVPQTPYLFSGTIKENIELGSIEDMTMNDVIEASSLANSNDFIDTLDQQYDTSIRERGSSLSGGQRQRIALARAFVRKAPLIILDEVTSSLDNESENLVSKSILQLLDRGTTVLFITHNLSLAQKADRIIVMDKGQIVEDGDHESLLSFNGLYAQLRESGYSEQTG